MRGSRVNKTASYTAATIGLLLSALYARGLLSILSHTKSYGPLEVIYALILLLLLSTSIWLVLRPLSYKAAAFVVVGLLGMLVQIVVEIIGTLTSSDASFVGVLVMPLLVLAVLDIAGAMFAFNAYVAIKFVTTKPTKGGGRHN